MCLNLFINSEDTSKASKTVSFFCTTLETNSKLKFHVWCKDEFLVGYTKFYSQQGLLVWPLRLAFSSTKVLQLIGVPPKCYTLLVFHQSVTPYWCSTKVLHLIGVTPYWCYTSESFSLKLGTSKKQEMSKFHFFLKVFKAAPRFELGDKGFAILCLTTWPCRRSS
jgi:hypothetical protein